MVMAGSGRVALTRMRVFSCIQAGTAIANRCGVEAGWRHSSGRRENVQGLGCVEGHANQQQSGPGGNSRMDRCREADRQNRDAAGPRKERPFGERGTRERMNRVGGRLTARSLQLAVLRVHRE